MEMDEDRDRSKRRTVVNSDSRETAGARRLRLEKEDKELCLVFLSHGGSIYHKKVIS